WRKANPSYPKRTPAQSMLRLKRKLTEEDWLREGMGIWDSNASLSVIDPVTWSARADESSVIDSRLALAVDVAPDRSVAAVSVAGQRADGDWHVEVDEQRNGGGWLFGYIDQRCERNDIRIGVVDHL